MPIVEKYPHRIYFTFPFEKAPFEIPVVPDVIVFGDEQLVTTLSVIALGEVSIPGSRKLIRLQWESHFPFTYDSMIEIVNQEDHLNPEIWRGLIRRTQGLQTSLRVSISGTDIDHEFIVQAFKGTYIPGPAGDIWYQIVLLEAKQGALRQFDGSAFPDLNLRGRPFGTLPTTYETIDGQTLEQISIILYGDSKFWVDLFNANLVVMKDASLARGILTEEEVQRRAEFFEVAQPLSSLWRPGDEVPARTLLQVPEVAGGGDE